MNTQLPNSYAAQGKPLPDRKDVVLNRAGSEQSSPTAGGPGGGRSTAQLVRESNKWRDAYNPLRNLVISKIVALCEAAERGDFAELQWTMRKVERRYPVLKGLKSRWESAIEEMDWDVKIVDKLPDGATKEMAEAQQKFLRSRYELIENLTEAIGFLATTDFRGYAILQKHRFTEGEHDGAVRELHWLPQWNFCRDGQFGDFYFNKGFRFGATPESCGEDMHIGGEALPRSEFVMREVDAPLYEIALFAFVNWMMGRKDWAACVEIFGLLKAIVIMPPNIPQGKEEEYRSAAERVSDGVAGALPAASDVKFPAAESRNNTPFKEYCDAQDSDVVLAGTGGRLAMLGPDKGGLGNGPAQEHADAFKEIGCAVARKINQTLQRDFDKIEINNEFEGQPVLAYFELALEDEEDSKAIVENYGIGVHAGALTPNQEDEAHFRAQLNLPPMSKDVIREWKKDGGARTPITLSQEGQPRPAFGQPNPNTPPAPIKNRAGVSPEESFHAALADKVDPVGQLIKRLAEIKDDAQMLAAFQQFLQHADSIKALVATDVARLTAALEAITKPALEKGINGK